MIDILERLSEPLVMSMFASSDDLYREQEKQRAEAAAEIAKLREENERLREVLEPFSSAAGAFFSKNGGSQDLVFDGGPTVRDCIFGEHLFAARAALEGNDNG